MRIGIDYTAAAHQRAGIGRYTRGLVTALAELDADDEFVLFVAGGRTPDGEQKLEAPLPGNFHIRKLPLSERMWTIIWHRARLPVPVNLFIGPVDVFHSPDYVLPHVSRGRAVVTIHDLSFLQCPEGSEPKLRRYLARAVPRAVSRADLVLADSHHTRKDIVELFGTSPDKVEVLYPGVEASFGPVRDEGLLSRARAAYGLNTPFILSVGTLEPRKNHVLLLDAYAALREKSNVEHKLVIAGAKGWLYEGVFRRVEELSLGEDVVFLGFVPDEDLPALYSLAEVFVFPSLYEGFGLPPLEAMACGTPVVACRSSSLPEVVGEAGLMVPLHDSGALADEIDKVLNDRGLRDSLAERGVSQAQKFTWRRAGSKLLALYRRLLG